MAKAKAEKDSEDPAVEARTPMIAESAYKELEKEYLELKDKFEVLSEPYEKKDDDPSEVISNIDITTYAHHGAMVQVRRNLKGQHRKHSLCYQCEYFKPETLNNCHISQAIFDNCVKLHVTTPVWECPSFKLAKK